MRRLASLIPERYARIAARYAIPISIVTVVLVVGIVAAGTALVSPGALGVSAARLAETTSLPDSFLASGLNARDSDLDGVSDSLENYVYGTNPDNWNSSGTGIPDGWLVQYGFDPLSPVLREQRGKAPAKDVLPEAYAKGYPREYTPLLSEYYAYAKPADYRPGVDQPWWRVGAHANPGVVDQTGSGVPTGWLLHYGLDVTDTRVDRVAVGSASNLTIRQAYDANTNPLKRDSDGDGIDDWIEIHVTRTDPSQFSTAGTGIADGWLLHFSLNAFDRDVASQDPDLDGLTNLEEFVFSYDTFRTEIAARGLAILYTQGLDPLEWQTAGTGIPDGWYVKYGLSPFGADVDTVIGRASDWPEARDFDSAPEGFAPKPDFVMTIRDSYSFGRPADWNEATKGVWWGGTNPVTLDTDEDGIPDPVEIRGWYANVTFEVGPDAKTRVYNATGNPLEADSDGDGLTDIEEYRGRATCDGQVRTFPPTDPRNRDTAFSGLSDLEKVCGVVRGSIRYDLNSQAGAVLLDPTRADSAGDHMRDGAALDSWHDRYVNYTNDPRYPYAGSRYRTLFEWTDELPRFAGRSQADVLEAFRPDGDVDNDGIPNVIDADPSGGLFIDATKSKDSRTKVFFLGGPQMDPALYRFTEFASETQRPATDPANPDTDGDGLPDSWETRYGRFDPILGGWNLDPTKTASNPDLGADGDANLDGDVFTWYAYNRRGASIVREANTFSFNNLLEYRAGTDPNELSTAFDDISDGWKVFWGGDLEGVGTFRALFAGRDPKVGDIVLEHADEVESALLSSPILPLADLRGVGRDSTGYSRFVNGLSDCAQSVIDARVKPLVRSNEFVPELGCYNGDHLSNVTGAIARIDGVFKLTYLRESQLRTNPYLADSDGDGSPDAYESFYLVRSPAGISYPDPAVADGDRSKDPDGDGVGHAAECGSRNGGKTCGLRRFTREEGVDTVEYWVGARPVPNPEDPSDDGKDTDRDGITDDIEIAAGLNPADPSDVGPFLRGNLDSDEDGMFDFNELIGGGSAFYDGENIRTDPQRFDSDSDGLLDGNAVSLVYLDPKKAGRTLTAEQLELNSRIEAWCAHGIAHTRRMVDGSSSARVENLCGTGMDTRILGDMTVNFFGERVGGYGLRPNNADTHALGIPEAWLVYHGLNPNEAQIDHASYALHRPSWWNEQLHGVWWWGTKLKTDERDLDADGLDDFNGEDPFPTLRLNRIVDGTTIIDDPSKVAAWVNAGATPAEVRARAQRIGDGAGDPVGARAANLVAVDTNGVYTRNDRATVELVNLVTPAAAVKGVPFSVTGRVVLNERNPAGGLLEGDETNRVGLPNRTVIVSMFNASRSTAGGIGFTDESGRFNFSALIGSQLEAEIPATGIVALGAVDGIVAQSTDPNLVSAGTATAGKPNRIVVWVAATSATVPEGHPTGAAHKANLADSNGVVAERTTVATRAFVAPARDVSVSTPTNFTLTTPSTVLNGQRIVGDLSLIDASGGGIADKSVIVRWTGVPGEARFNNLSTDRNGRVNITNLQIPIGVPVADVYTFEATFTSNNPYLFSTTREFELTVRDPTVLAATAAKTAVLVGEDLVVSGDLTTKPVAIPGGGSTVRLAVAGTPVTLRIGGQETTAVTDDAGRFNARVTIPAALNAGDQALTIDFAGSRLAAPSQASIILQVKRAAEVFDLGRIEGPRSAEETLRGKLMETGGSGFAGTIEVYQGTTRIARGQADETGTFALKVPLRTIPLGTQTVRVVFPGDDTHGPAENFTRARVTSATRLVVTEAPDTVVRGAPFVLGVRLLDDQGVPVVGVPVQVAFRGEPVAVLITDAKGEVSQTIETNLTERTGVTEAGFSYQPIASSVLTGATARAPLRVVAATVLEFSPPPAFRGPIAISGQLINDEGLPLLAQSIDVYLDGKFLGGTRTGRNGLFTLEQTLPLDRPLGDVKLRASFSGSDRLAPVSREIAWAIQSPLSLDITRAGPFVRGEGAPIEGTLADDRGLPVDLAMRASIDGREIGTVRTAGGVLKGNLAIPAATERGERVLSLAWEGDSRYPAFTRDIPVVIKIRPSVDVDLPRIAVRGFAFGGDVTLLDDRGEPLRNTTFIYTLGEQGTPVLGRTDNTGQAKLASIAPIGGNAFFALSVRGGDDVVPAEYRTQSLQVIGPATPVGYAGLIVVILIALAIIAVVIIAIVLRRRQLGEVRDIIEEAIRELVAGNEYAGTIFLAYRRLAAHVARHGFSEKEADTPREFASSIRKAIPVGDAPLKGLITLFEEARYSDHALGTEERDRAVEHLARVRNDIDAILGTRPEAQA